MNNGLIGYISFESEVPPDLFMGLPLVVLIVYIYIIINILTHTIATYKHLNIRVIMTQVAVGAATVADFCGRQGSGLTAR